MIPVVVENLEEVLPVLAAVCAVTEGRLLNTVEAEFQAAVPGSGSPLRGEALRVAMTGHPFTTRHVDLVDGGGGLVDAVFADPPGSPSSLGEQTVLAVARAIVHSDLDSHSLVVIAYRESPIDLPFRRAIWTLAMMHLQGMPNATLRTLVLVAESTIDTQLHCQSGRGFRLALEGGRLLRRNGIESLNVSAGRIAEHTTPFVLFLGAGFGGSSHLPLGDALRDSAIRRLLGVRAGDIVPSPKLAGRFYQWVWEQGWLSAAEQAMSRADYASQLTLEQVTAVEAKVDPSLPTLREFKAHHDRVVVAPGPAVVDLAYLVAHGVGRLILVTVNFDELVEAAAGASVRRFVTSEEFGDAPAFLERYLRGEEGQVPLLKLHGTISDLPSCVVSDEQTALGLGQAKLDALRVLLSDDPKRLWIYVGASLRDRDVRPALLHEEFGRGLDERWVSPYISESIEQYGALRAPVWRRTGLATLEERFITEVADAFFAAVRRGWR